jgi:hypothetical protein
MKFQKWQHPKTDEVRIYVNGAAGFGVKVYVVDGGVTGHYPADFPEVVVRADHMIGQSQVDAIMNDVEQHVCEALSLDRGMKYSDIVKLAP